MKLIDNIINRIKYRNQRLLLAGISFFLLLLVVCYFVFLPALRQSRLLSYQIKEKKTNLARLQALTGEYNRLEAEVNKTKDQLQILKNRLLWERDISRLLNELTQLASNLQIEIVSLKPESATLPREKEKKEPGDYLLARVSISVTLKSDYDNAIKFLRRIEEADKFINIDLLSIESGQRDIYKHNVKMKLSIFTEEEV